MFRCLNETAAKELANKHGKSYGFSCLDGKWYVGTHEELRKIGVVKPAVPVESLQRSLAELVEICRVKCSPLDEVILPNGRTNHDALVDAVKMLG